MFGLEDELYEKIRILENEKKELSQKLESIISDMKEGNEHHSKYASEFGRGFVQCSNHFIPHLSTLLTRTKN